MPNQEPPIPHRVWVLSDGGEPVQPIGVIPGRSRFLNAMFCFFYDQKPQRRLAVEVIDPETGEGGELYEVVPLVPKVWHPAIAFVPVHGPMPIPRAFTDAIRAAAVEHPELTKTLEFLEGHDSEIEEIEDEPESEPEGEWS